MRGTYHEHVCSRAGLRVSAYWQSVSRGSLRQPTSSKCPWENGYCESFNGKLRDELLNGEIFHTLKEAQIVIENWRNHYNTIRPRSSLEYRPSAPEALVWPVSKLVAQTPALN